jgi:hypothetical protein
MNGKMYVKYSHQLQCHRMKLSKHVLSVWWAEPVPFGVKIKLCRDSEVFICDDKDFFEL